MTDPIVQSDPAATADGVIAADEAFLRRLLAASPDCVKVLDLDARLLSMTTAGQRALEIDDLTPHLGKCWTDWWRGPDHAAAAVAVAEAKAGGTGRFEAPGLTAKGSPRWWDVTVTAIPGPDGRPERLLSVSRDVTAQRAARDAAAERADRLRSVIESAADYAVISVDAAGIIDGWSTGAVHTFGWTAGEAVGRSFDLIWTDEDRAAGSPGRELAAAREHGSAADNRWHRRADGGRVYASGATRPVHDAAGRLTGFVKVCRDETVQRRTEDALADARRRSDAALLAGEVGTFTWDLGGDRLWGDANFARLFGLAADADGGFPLADYLAAIHPDDRAGTSAKINRTVAAGVPYEAEYRIVHRDGGQRWVVARGRVEPDGGGRAVRFSGVIVDVTERRQAEQDLADARRRLEAALTGGQIATWVWDLGADRLFADVNMTAFFRLPPDGGRGLPVATYADTLHPDDRPKVMAALDRAVATGGDYVAEYRIVTFDPPRWAYARARVERDDDGRPVRLAGVVLDVTDRRRAEADLAFERHQLELIWCESPAAMALWRGEGLVFERLNPQYQALFAGRDLAGRPLLDALPELRGQGFDDLLLRVLRTGEPHVGREVLARLARTAGGPLEDRYFDFSYLQVRDPDGRPWGVYDHAVDVTDRVVARQALERSEAQLRAALADRERLLASERAARAEVEQAGRMKDEFLATLSHELRTPLNAIVGWTQILRDPAGNGPDDYAEGLAVIDRNARAQTQIIEDILDMSRIVSGKLQLNVHRVDLPDLVQAGVDTVRVAADAKGVRLTVVLDPLAGAVVGDPSRLHQVFWNLLSNAVKFTPKGGRVQVVLERVNSHVEVTVTDTGEGIDPAFLPHVFDRFRQADSSTTRRHGGLGLGLSIVKQLVELHGGGVRVKSPGRGMGATFVVALPLTVIQPEPVADDGHGDHAAADLPDHAHRVACGQLAGVTVVAVDDEPDAVAMVARLLANCGAVVRTATSAADAVALVAADPPDVLVSDIGMPGEDGYALIRRVRGLPPDGGGRVHACALTAYARAADRMRALEAGFQLHLAKPVEPAELVVTVAALAKLAGDAHPG